MSEPDKREKIIVAAYKVLSENGYDRASTKEISRCAGVAQGLINYYFPSKDLLFEEVFRRETMKYCDSFNQLARLSDQPLTIDALMKILKEVKKNAKKDPNWYRLRYELYAIGLREGNTSAILKEMLQTKRMLIGSIVGTFTHLSQEDASAVASIMYSVFDGLGMQRIVDPDFDYDRAFDTLTVMLGKYFEDSFMNKD
ncbi:TetR/AcrR family transcriptional regulator [Paenibacillus sepulcri]|jgi:AcrR family transcriptional regulator|uniref:TetR/AcrR family transcriptional regulator n=1 Tax=Paenibacillus sepulcri TaxID=359917 RepID=A0ABS7BZ38_9BACL|nr:TetR/AcrR family transcriptional regulator [Paenibacillus sepulcri]